MTNTKLNLFLRWNAETRRFELTWSSPESSSTAPVESIPLDLRRNLEDEARAQLELAAKAFVSKLLDHFEAIEEGKTWAGRVV